MKLPHNIDPQYFDLHYRMLPDWHEAVREIAETHGFPTQSVAPFTDGSNLVANVDETCIVKIFPPFHRHQWESEYRVLEQVQALETIRTPRLLASGERPDGWTYVVVECLNGLPLAEIWMDISPENRGRLLFQIGRVMAEVHARPIGPLATLPPEWTGFVAQQAAGARARHARLGAPVWLLDQLPAFVAPHVEPLRTLPDRVILTGEYTPFNLLATFDGACWNLSGMFDFGDAMIGPPLYDWLGPSVFLAGGDAALLHQLECGYGMPGFLRAQRARLMAMMLLHRYSNLAFQIQIPDWEERADALEALAVLIWPE